jgi:hypothetical protein
MSEVKTEQKEVSETPSPVTESEQLEMDFDFLPKEEAENEGPSAPEAKKVKEEVIMAGDTKVIFREPTSEELPTQAVPQAHTGVIGQNFFSEGQEWQATVVGKSPSGNQLQITKRHDGTGYQLGWRNGGEVPARYSGWYTTYEKAETSARLHLAELWEVARKAG